MVDEETLRALVREAIARRERNAEGSPGPPRVVPLRSDASHFRYILPESDGPCLIEPSVQCVHCGYCQSHGH
jgi:hypothetical protein